MVLSVLLKATGKPTSARLGASGDSLRGVGVRAGWQCLQVALRSGKHEVRAENGARREWGAKVSPSPTQTQAHACTRLHTLRQRSLLPALKRLPIHPEGKPPASHPDTTAAPQGPARCARSCCMSLPLPSFLCLHICHDPRLGTGPKEARGPGAKARRLAAANGEAEAHGRCQSSPLTRGREEGVTDVVLGQGACGVGAVALQDAVLLDGAALLRRQRGEMSLVSRCSAPGCREPL